MKLREDYVPFLEEVISPGYADKVPQNVLDRSDGKVWFIPHDGVYHHKKPDKIRVVFNCSAQFHRTSLNKELFQGPDLTNSLFGVLIRFRQDPVAVMGVVHLLRFLWWPKEEAERVPDDGSSFRRCIVAELCQFCYATKRGRQQARILTRRG